MAEEIIKARVWTKVDTLENWNNNPLLLGPGEMALVTTPSGIPLNMKWGDKNERKRFSDLPFAISYDQGQFVAIEGPGELPTPESDVAYSLVGPGTYTYPGQEDIVVDEGHWGQVVYNDGEWSFVDMGELPAVDINGEVLPLDNRAVSGDTIYNTLSPYISIGKDVETELYRGNGTFTATGSYRLSDNWISTRIVEISPLGGEVFTVEGYQESGNKIVLFYTEADELNQTPFEFSYGSSNPSPQTFTTPSGYTKMIIQVASGTNIGADIPNSPYQESFRLIRGEIPRVKAEMVKGVIDTPQLNGLRSDITALQNKPDFATFEGIGFPQYELGVDGDKYFDYASKRVFTKQHGKWVPKSLSRFYPITVPTEFGWDIGRRIMYQESGKGFIEGWKGLFEEKAKSDFDRLTKYYVSRSVGNDSNDGLTPETAFATVEHAHSIGARNIIVEQGVYAITDERQMRVIVDDDEVTEPFIVRCLEGKAIMTRAFLGNEYPWTAVGDAYRASRTNVINVVDLTYFDNEGNYAQLVRVDSVQECQDLPGSYYPLSATIHVHTFDSRVPDENILLCFAAATGYTPGELVPYVYMENISVINQQASGSSGAFAFRNNISEQYDCEVYLKNCYAGNNSLGDGIAIDNIKVAILEGCSSAYTYRDALNYHTSLLSAGYEPIKVLEIDCEGYDTGTYWSGEYSSNGSTMHEGGTILRINGNYRRGSGSVVVDVNPGIRSLNIGVEANDTTLNDGFRINGEDSMMWLYGCVAYSDLEGANSLRAQDGAVACYDSRCIFPNNIEGDVVEI